MINAIIRSAFNAAYSLFPTLHNKVIKLKTVFQAAPGLLRTASFIICSEMVILSLLSGCKENGSDTEKCTSSSTLTSSGVEVDINGNVTPNPTPTSTSSGCESSSGSDGTGSDGTIELTASLITRFISSDDYAVWDCTRADGSSLHYALPRRAALPGAPRLKVYAFEIDPSAADPYGSQRLYAWSASTSTTGVSSTIKLWTMDKMGDVSLGIQSEWTDIIFETADTMSLDSSTKGPMQCNRSVGIIELDSNRFDIPCKYRPGGTCSGTAI